MPPLLTFNSTAFVVLASLQQPAHFYYHFLPYILHPWSVLPKLYAPVSSDVMMALCPSHVSRDGSYTRVTRSPFSAWLVTVCPSKYNFPSKIVEEICP